MMAMYTVQEAIGILDTMLDDDSDESDIEEDLSFPLPRSESEDEESIDAYNGINNNNNNNNNK